MGFGVKLRMIKDVVVRELGPKNGARFAPCLFRQFFAKFEPNAATLTARKTASQVTRPGELGQSQRSRPFLPREPSTAKI